MPSASVVNDPAAIVEVINAGKGRVMSEPKTCAVCPADISSYQTLCNDCMTDERLEAIAAENADAWRHGPTARQIMGEAAFRWGHINERGGPADFGILPSGRSKKLTPTQIRKLQGF